MQRKTYHIKLPLREFHLISQQNTDRNYADYSFLVNAISEKRLKEMHKAFALEITRIR
jgi:hypothetical protein